MKGLYVLLSAMLGSVVAHADMIKPATLNLVCTSPRDARVIKIVSSQQGSLVTVNGTKVLQRDQLTAGTEGGPPYLQAVGGGYNITLSGGDFEKAFYASSKITNGKAQASISDPSNKRLQATCRGLYSF